MRVELWSEITCPWCGLGHHRLQQALARFEHGAELQVEHHSFQLDPSLPTDRRIPVRELLRSKYGLDEARFLELTGRIEAMAAADGLQPYRVGDNYIGNTGPAHEFLAFAQDHGQGPQAWALLYRTYFGEGGSVFDLPSLLALGQALGLPGPALEESLRTGRLRARVKQDAREAQRLGATGAPFLVLDRRLAVAGAQPVEVLLKALAQAWSTRNGAQYLGSVVPTE